MRTRSSHFRTIYLGLAFAFATDQLAQSQDSQPQDSQSQSQPSSDPTITVLTLYPELAHLRATGVQEWSSFPVQADHSSLRFQFSGSVNADDGTLTLRQQDVKESWHVFLNDERLGRLVRNENDLVVDLVVPAGGIVAGVNTIEIRQTGKEATDDIRVGQIELANVSPDTLRGRSVLQIEIVDKNREPLPGRLTVVNRNGTLMPVTAKVTADAETNHALAVRPGVVYTANGIAEFRVAPGEYQIYAGRGFEYSVQSSRVIIKAGDRVKRTFQLSREVDTSGWVACDTHVHTVTHSGHGDASMEERMVTLAGEGIELPIATDHNKHIDYDSIASQLGVRSYFTPVIGNEVTTKKGHFNIFPVQKGSEIPDYNQTDWAPLFQNIFAVPGVKVAILNHARDLHSGYRPFSPRHHISLSGENLDDRILNANAMELINSGAVQTDPMQLYRDWCGLLNGGLLITPVGSSDSHDVARYIVGQGRTYIRCDDTDVGNIDVDKAVKAFVEGRVVVSYGLMVTLRVNDKFGPGEMASVARDSNEVEVVARVLAPSWVDPSSVQLFVNGQPRFTADLRRADHSADQPFQSTTRWQIPRSELTNDVWLSAVARGDGVSTPYWTTAKPYQADSIEFTPYTFSCTGPVRVDADGDKVFTSADAYAHQLINQCSADPQKVAQRLESFDDAVAIQAASILLAGNTSDGELTRAAAGASKRVRTAWTRFQRAKRQSITARLEQAE